MINHMTLMWKDYWVGTIFKSLCLYEMKSNGEIICLCVFSITSLSLNIAHIKDIDI